MAETGTNAGFHVIAEARDYLIQVSYTHIDWGLFIARLKDVANA